MDAVVWGGRLLLTADDGVRGRELWSTDGTSVGTRRVKDANPGPAGSDPSQLVVIGNRVFFQANDPAHGTELWSTDGTEQGTELVKDIHPVVSLSGLPLSSFPFDFTPFAGRLLFTADDGSKGGELWASDGTASGTRLVKSINPISYYRPRSLTVVGNQLLFFANDGANGEELWRTDSSLQTTLLKDIFPGKDSGISDSGVLLGVLKTTLGERLLFTADNGEKGEELWISDGTSQGTFLLKDIHPGSQGTDISKPTLVGNQLFFMVDSSGSTPELWCTDGTTDGTRLVKSFPQGANAFDFSLSALPSGTLMLQRTNGQGAHELWRSTGTSAGTTQLKQINPGSGIASGSPNVMSTSSVVVGNKLFFSANDGKSGQELWVSDGTTAGTFLVKNIRPDLAGSSPRELTAVGNQVVFWANDGSTGEELWISDGTTVGTRPLADLNPGLPSATAPLAGGSSSFDPTIKVLSGNTIIFNADDGLNGIEPWALKISAPPPPSASVLAIAPLAATKAEATGGAVTPFTFQVRRSGKASGVSTAVWSVVGTGSKPANGADFSGGVLPRGTVSFAAGQTSRTITVNVRGDLLQEGDETFRVSLSAPTGAVLTTAAATGTILNDDLIGDAKANTLVGTARAEFLDGRANVDTLTGGRAADVFGFRFGESPLAAPDRITDFAFGTDKIDLLTASGGTLPAPGSLSRAANNSTAKSLGALAAAVFTDANGARAGNQALGAKSAALVRATHAAIAGTYLVVNNAVAGRSNSDDLMIKLNGFTGALPALGAIPINSVFL
jgi:ELWxxDGT repeat protein